MTLRLRMASPSGSLSVPDLEYGRLLCICWERTVLLAFKAGVSETVAIMALVAHAASTLGTTAKHCLVSLATVSAFRCVDNSCMPRQTSRGRLKCFVFGLLW